MLISALMVLCLVLTILLVKSSRCRKKRRIIRPAPIIKTSGNRRQEVNPTAAATVLGQSAAPNTGQVAIPMVEMNKGQNIYDEVS